MTDLEILNRLERVYAVFGEKSNLKPEDFKSEVIRSGPSLEVRTDFGGGRSQIQLETDAASILNEIMGIRDRTTKWLKAKGQDPRQVDTFIKSDRALSLVHDLANTDKHGELDRTPFSGVKPQLRNIGRALALTYDPSTGMYASVATFCGPAIDTHTGEVAGVGSSSGCEVVLAGEVVDESGNAIYDLHKLLPDAIYRWEKFLQSLGLSLP